jgi:hypothetical protein
MPGRMLPGESSPYWNPEIARNKNLEGFFRANTNLLQDPIQETVLPQYDWAAKAAQLGASTSELSMQSAINSINNAAQQNLPGPSGQSGPSNNPVAGAGNPRLWAILKALSAQESGNNYGAVNADSGAMGRWQVMPSNIQGPGGWDKEALGRDITTQQFLNRKKLQNKIVAHKFGQYLQNHGLRGALSAWYSGDPSLWNDKDPQGNYPSIHDYVMQVLRRLGLA